MCPALLGGAVRSPCVDPAVSAGACWAAILTELANQARVGEGDGAGAPGRWCRVGEGDGAAAPGRWCRVGEGDGAGAPGRWCRVGEGDGAGPIGDGDALPEGTGTGTGDALREGTGDGFGPRRCLCASVLDCSVSELAVP